MIVIEPHIHMYSRTTDDYQAMYAAGIRACVEPSLWLGELRRYAGSFWDYFNVALNYETVRARRYGVDHYAAVAVSPKECEDARLVDEVLAGMGEYLDHERCVAVGELGYNLITKNEEAAFLKQLDLARARNLPVIIHSPHTNKLKGVKRIIEVLREQGMDCPRVIIDHNTEETIAASHETNCYCGMTVYPYSKLSPQRVSAMIRQHGSERMIVNGSADWGISSPVALVQTAEFMKQDGHGPQTIQRLLFENAMAFYSQSARWKPDFNIQPQDPREFQR
jgi:uncharacterized protein